MEQHNKQLAARKYLLLYLDFGNPRMVHETMSWNQFDVRMRPPTQPYYEGDYFTEDLGPSPSTNPFTDFGSYLCKELAHQKPIIIDNPGVGGGGWSGPTPAGLLGYHSMIFHGDGLNTVNHDGVHLNLVQTGPNNELINHEQSSEKYTAYNSTAYLAYHSQQLADGFPSDTGHTGPQNGGLGFSVSWWMWIHSTQPNGQRILWGDNTINFVEIRGEGTTGARFQTESALGNGWNFGNFYTSLPLQTWMHWTITFSPNQPRQTKWYKDGVHVHTAANNMDDSIDGNSSSPVGAGLEYFSFSRVGCSGGNSNYPYTQSFKGLIPILYTHKVELTAAEVKQNYEVHKWRHYPPLANVDNAGGSDFSNWMNWYYLDYVYADYYGS